MRETRIARRYALALFKTAQASGNLEIVATDIHQIKSFAQKDKRFLGFLQAPQVPTEQKKALLRGLFTTRLAPRLLLFFELLLDKHRTNIIADIADEFEKLMEDHLGLIKARVITAVHLTDEMKSRLREKLEKISGKKVEIIHRIDKAVIGGVIVYLHNTVIDRSIRRQIEVLRHNLLKVKVH
jgi:F-type H+-transporting ATPase subunit delta